MAKTDDGSFLMLEVTFADNGECVTTRYSWEEIQEAELRRRQYAKNPLFSSSLLYEVKPMKILAMYDENLNESGKEGWHE